MSTIHRTLACIALAVSPLALAAQSATNSARWSVELNADGAFPIAKLGAAELSTGFGLGANFRLRLQQHLLAYAGWEYHAFSSDQILPSETADAEETGYVFGLRFEHPFRAESFTNRSAGYWLRGGAIVKHIEIENEAGDIVSDTKHGLGYELGAGVLIPLTDRLALTPGARVQSLSRDLTVGPSTNAVTLRYVSAIVGLTINF